MANITEAFKGPNPYQATEIRSWSTQELLALGYVQVGPEGRALSEKLHQTVETIKSFFWMQCKLIGLDEQGKMPPFFVHFDADNAFYHPQTLHRHECFAFNDKFVANPEVVCHEFTHGVLENINRLGNEGEAGAINESVADIVGIVFKRAVYGSKDWKIGDRRDLNQPPEKFDSAEPKYDEKGNTTNDNGHVHHNGTLLSYAFVVASGGLGGMENQLLKIWWDAVVELKDHEKTFRGFANKTIEIAGRAGFPIRDAIIEAWRGAKVIS